MKKCAAILLYIFLKLLLNSFAMFYWIMQLIVYYLICITIYIKAWANTNARVQSAMSYMWQSYWGKTKCKKIFLKRWHECDNESHMLTSNWRRQVLVPTLKGIVGNTVKPVAMVWGFGGPSKKSNSQTWSRQTDNDTMSLGCSHLSWQALCQRSIKVKIFLTVPLLISVTHSGQTDGRRHTQLFPSASAYLKQRDLRRCISVWSPPKGVRVHIHL